MNKSLVVESGMDADELAQVVMLRFRSLLVEAYYSLDEMSMDGGRHLMEHAERMCKVADLEGHLLQWAKGDECSRQMVVGVHFAVQALRQAVEELE